jgi:sugar lactone lactonase YvrE
MIILLMLSRQTALCARLTAILARASTLALWLAALWAGSMAFAQRPDNHPELMIPQNAPALDYRAVADPLPLPSGTDMGAPASTAFDSRGHHFVLFRGPRAFGEFDTNGKFMRAFGDGLFIRAHGLRIDKDDNLWATDVSGHIVVKVNPRGQVLLTLGTKGKPGEWNEAAGSRLLNQPNDLAIAGNGDIFVVQGHSPFSSEGDPRVLKFDRNGKFIKSWGGKGSAPGKFEVAHGIAIDAQGLLWVADRENQRIQVFNQDGTFVRELKYAGLPCSLWIGSQYIYMVNGFAGQLLRLDLNGKVLAAVGKIGKGVGEFGEAHSIAVSPQGEIWVADTINEAVQKFVKQ